MPVEVSRPPSRSLGLLGATGIGVGAIVGGGVLALAGTAFATAGPSALVAFALNGLIAIITVLSFAELSAAFPENGGPYVFSKKVFSVQAAFLVGWVVWFASVVAGVLYALGFASYAISALTRLSASLPVHLPFPISAATGAGLLAVGATLAYTLGLIRKSGGGGQWATWGKVVVFAIIIAAGGWVLAWHRPVDAGDRLTPFFAGGPMGLAQAMGYTFIALQGFDIIAAVAGEVRQPARIIPRAMMLSLAIALAIYLPLLLVIATAGAGPDQGIVALSRAHPETVIAVAVQHFMGPAGFWMVIAAAIMAMLSALRANLLAASRVVQAMSTDRTLPRRLSFSGRFSTPTAAICASAAMVVLIIVLIPNVAAAGAAASLIFLLSFAMVHWIAILARIRTGHTNGAYQTPWFPLLPIIGGVACLALAVFQGIQVPAAGKIALIWLTAGGVLYLTIFAQRAKVVDAASEAMDPELVKLRGRRPLVLVPLANPSNADFMVGMASALAPPKIGRVLLLSIVSADDDGNTQTTAQRLRRAQTVLHQGISSALTARVTPEALTTIAASSWPEIKRVANAYRCESLLLGLSDLDHGDQGRHLERLMSQVDADVAVLRASRNWQLHQVKRVIVPVGGGGHQDRLRARLLGSLYHSGVTAITFVRILPATVSDAQVQTALMRLNELAEDELAGRARTQIIRGQKVADDIIGLLEEDDLLVLGLQRLGRRKKVFGQLALTIARHTRCSLMMISSRG